MKFSPTSILVLRMPLRSPLVAISAACWALLTMSCALVEVPSGADLRGTWSQTGEGYENGHPVIWENQTLVIEEAQGQGFTGYKRYTRDGERPKTEAVNGVIGFDGNVLITDEDGTFEGRLVDGKIRGQYAEVGRDASAINIELSRKQ